MCLNCWALDDLTVLVGFNPTCYSWNHETVQFDPVHIDDQVLIPKLSPDGKLLACWFDDDSQIHSFNFGLRIWDVADVPNTLDIHICCKA